MNLYVHFPFCRRRCSYCTLFSRTGTTAGDRNAYVVRLATFLRESPELASYVLDTVYFGGGSPGICNLRPLFEALAPRLAHGAEFTVELHPLDVSAELLDTLADGGVNRISLGVQSLDDAILTAMGRGYDFARAERAFAQVRNRFDNAGIDLIVGYPGETAALLPRHARLAKWGLRHCSVYALQNERRLPDVPDDDTVMNRLSVTAAFLADLGLERYEISNYAVSGYECRHNMAVWRGEDYVGLGDGACGRIGLWRTRHFGGAKPECETVDAATDATERRIFRLRTREGLDASDRPAWREPLHTFVRQGLMMQQGDTYRLTSRGMEVCDTILATLV